MTDQEKLTAVQTIFGNETKYRLALFLHAKKKATTMEIAEHLGLSRNHTSFLLVKMEAAGTADHDGTKVEHYHYFLTRLGKQILKAV